MRYTLDIVSVPTSSPSSAPSLSLTPTLTLSPSGLPSSLPSSQPTTNDVTYTMASSEREMEKRSWEGGKEREAEVIEVSMEEERGG